MKKLRFFLLYILIVCVCYANQEILNILNDIKLKNTETLNLLDTALSKDSFLLLFDEKQDYIYYEIYEKYKEKYNKAFSYKTTADSTLEEATLLIEKSIYFDRTLSTSEAELLKHYYEDIVFYSSKFTEASIDLISSFTLEYSTKEFGLNPMSVNIGIPINESDLTNIIKQQTTLSKEEMSITLLYTFATLPPKEYSFNYELKSPSGKIYTDKEPMKWTVEENSFLFQWFWNFTYKEDFQEEIGEWEIKLILDGNIASTQKISLI